MSNYDRIGTLYDKVEKLVGVRYAVFDDDSEGRVFVTAVEMRFESIVATVYVEPDYDTLRLELGEMRVDPDCIAKAATSTEPWAKAVGKTLSWIWLLTNQQGYEDGFRFEFAGREKESPTVITLIGIASSIEMYVSQRLAM